MKTLIKAALAATVATGLFAAPAFAAPNTDSADFTARAKIVKAVTLTKNSNLNFGTITMMNALTFETVKVGQTPAGNSCGTGVGVTCSFPTQAAATFTVTGVPTQALDVVVSGDIFTTTNLPMVNHAQGGFYAGLLDALNALLDIAVPGIYGPSADEQGGF